MIKCVLVNSDRKETLMMNMDIVIGIATQRNIKKVAKEKRAMMIDIKDIFELISAQKALVKNP